MAGGTQYYNYEASGETLFLSSQDVWKNINNASFIDASGEKIEVQTIPEEGEKELTYYIERL